MRERDERVLPDAVGLARAAPVTSSRRHVDELERELRAARGTRSVSATSVAHRALALPGVELVDGARAVGVVAAVLGDELAGAWPRSAASRRCASPRHPALEVGARAAELVEPARDRR